MYLPYTGLAHPQQQVAPFGVGMQAQCICVFYTYAHVFYTYRMVVRGGRIGPVMPFECGKPRRPRAAASPLPLYGGGKCGNPDTRSACPQSSANCIDPDALPALAGIIRATTAMRIAPCSRMLYHST